MDIRELIVSALKPIDIPTYWIKWKGDTNPPDEYLTFQTVSRPDSYADDAYSRRRHYIYIDLFSEGDPYMRVPEIRKAMESAGMIEVDMRDVSQTAMSVSERVDYHISWTWTYLEVV